MKNYPRLYSLSTLGIRQHQEFDYQFHGFRTDFVGDSGCGKSMIADLVQLVFVGSEVFHSGTDSMDKREVDGMVLRTAGGRGTDMAYVLLNIEVKPQQFLALGAYLESSTRQSRSFIIHKDYNEQELRPFTQPLTVSDIYINEQIPTMEWFRESLEKKDLVLHSYSSRKKFHAYLFKHDLLSIDLSQSTQILRDYAMIIQSFSRGKSLDISDSSSLKRFLFGNEKAKEISEKYRTAVEELQITLREYAQNRSEIELVTKKYQALKSLDELRGKLSQDEEDFLLKACTFTLQQQNESYLGFKESSQEYLQAISTLQTILEILSQARLSEAETLDTLTIDQEAAQARYNKSLISHQAIKPFLVLMESYQCNEGELLEIYQDYQQNKHRHQLRETIGDALEKALLSQTLSHYGQYSSVSKILEEIQSHRESCQGSYTQKRQLLDFADLNNAGSMGYWAIQNYQSRSLEVESLLMFFKDLPAIQAQETSDRYVPVPEQLLSEMPETEKNERGFWVSLGALRQFVPYVSKRLFAEDNVEELRVLLATMSTSLVEEIKALSAKLTKLDALREFILSEPKFAEYLLVYQHDQLQPWHEPFESVATLEIHPQEFEIGMAKLNCAQQITEEFEAAEKDWKATQKALSDYERVMNSLKSSEEKLNNFFSGTGQQAILTTINTTFPELAQALSSNGAQLDHLSSKFKKSASSDQWVKDTISGPQRNISSQDINKQLEDYQGSRKACEDTFQETRLRLQREPDISTHQGRYLEYPREEEKRYEINKGIYEEKFKEIAGLYAPSEAYRFQVTQNYLELCTVVLPDAFLDARIEQNSSIEIIGEYLSQINDKNKSLNNRKLLKLRDILDEVGDEVSKREDTVRQIHNFLDNGEREITGGHRVSLRVNTLNCYPKGWINAYIEKLTEENTLFTTGQTLTELLSDSMSLEEKMINAFHAFGGHRGSKPKVEELLNPNSYFDLTFKMESQASGKTNIGSTGQVYAAIALLCIARLSLVNKGAFNKTPPPGIRFMPIDEAEGLGSNFDLLYDIARKFDYQIFTMGIKPLGRFKEGEQYIYMLSNNRQATEEVNHTPFAIFCDADQEAAG